MSWAVWALNKNAPYLTVGDWRKMYSGFDEETSYPRLLKLFDRFEHWSLFDTYIYRESIMDVTAYNDLAHRFFQFTGESRWLWQSLSHPPQSLEKIPESLPYLLVPYTVV